MNSHDRAVKVAEHRRYFQSHTDELLAHKLRMLAYRLRDFTPEEREALLMTAANRIDPATEPFRRLATREEGMEFAARFLPPDEEDQP